MESQVSQILRTLINFVQILIIPGLIKDLCIMPLSPKTSQKNRKESDSAHILPDHNHMQLPSPSNQ